MSYTSFPLTLKYSEFAKHYNLRNGNIIVQLYTVFKSQIIIIIILNSK